MNKKSIFRSLFIWTMLCISGIIIGQPPRGPLVMSPQINPDKTVVFRYMAPNAKDVKLSAQFEKGPVAMTKDARCMERK